MTTTRAAGRTITAGEMAEHFGALDPVEPIRVTILGDSYEITEVDDTEVRTIDGDDDPAQDAYDLLEELHEFKGTKAAMLKLVADYFAKD